MVQFFFARTWSWRAVCSPPHLKPHTLHPTPYTLHPTPFTLHPAPYTLHPTPCTLCLHPTSCTLHPALFTLHPTPFTLHPAPYTLHPTPYPTPHTPHPTPYTLPPKPHTLHPRGCGYCVPLLSFHRYQTCSREKGRSREKKKGEATLASSPRASPVTLRTVPLRNPFPYTAGSRQRWRCGSR